MLLIARCYKTRVQGLNSCEQHDKIRRAAVETAVGGEYLLPKHVKFSFIDFRPNSPQFQSCAQSLAVMLGGRVAQYGDTGTPWARRFFDLPANRQQSMQWKIDDFPRLQGNCHSGR